MKTTALKIARIGNSQGVRLPAATLRRYRMSTIVWMEERSDGIMLRPAVDTPEKLSWEDTACEMAAAGEDWGEWAATDADGLDVVPWDKAALRVAEPKARYGGRHQAKAGR